MEAHPQLAPNCVISPPDVAMAGMTDNLSGYGDPNRNASFDDSPCQPTTTVPASSDANSDMISRASEGPVPLRDADGHAPEENAVG